MKSLFLFLFLLLSSFLFGEIGQIVAIKGKIEITRDSNIIIAKLGKRLKKMMS